MKSFLLANTLKYLIQQGLPKSDIVTTVDDGHIILVIDDLEPYILPSEENFTLKQVEDIAGAFVSALSEGFND